MLHCETIQECKKKNPTVDTDRNQKQHTPETNIEKKKKPKLKKTQMLF